MYFCSFLWLLFVLQKSQLCTQVALNSPVWRICDPQFSVCVYLTRSHTHTQANKTEMASYLEGHHRCVWLFPSFHCFYSWKNGPFCLSCPLETVVSLWSCYGSSQARAKKLNTFIISTIFPCHVAIKLSLNRVLYVLIWLSPFFSPLWLQLKDFKSHMSCFIINNTTVRLQCFCKHSGFISSLSFKCCADKRGCLVF